MATPRRNCAIAQSRDLGSLADELGLVLELGTRGIAGEHLANFLRLADILGAMLVSTIPAKVVNR